MMLAVCSHAIALYQALRVLAIAQLVERRTVVDKLADILRSAVRLRLARMQRFLCTVLDCVWFLHDVLRLARGPVFYISWSPYFG